MGISVLYDDNHIVFLDELWFASRGEWHQTAKKAHDNLSTYWIDVFLGDNRTARLEYDNPERRDVMWYRLVAAMTDSELL